MADETTNEDRPNARKVREGHVTSNGMDKTELAAMTATANVLLNLNETITK